MRYNPNWIAAVRIDPNSAATANAVVHPDVLRDHLLHSRLSQLGQLAGIILGQRVLEAPTAVFKGLNRRLHSEGIDNFVFIYISKPRCTYRFQGRRRPAEALLPPKNSVFATYLTLNRSLQRQVRHLLDDAPEAAFRGVILGWEWLPEAPGTPGLPNEHATRYSKRIWRWHP